MAVLHFCVMTVVGYSSFLVCCCLAGALAENPRILLLDELTTFLDMEDQFGVLDAVKGVTQRCAPARAVQSIREGSG
eukprot:1153767-Pelagomonas_calceolata.AAC.2